jgi:hypothetical protein
LINLAPEELFRLEKTIMSLNLNPQSSGTASRYCTSPAYTEAVNDAQFVRPFGIAALVASIVMIFRPEVTVGIGLAVLGFGKSTFYRVLGLSVVITGILGILIGPLRILGSTVLCVGVGLKGINVLGILAREGKDDPDYQDMRKRAIVGIVFSAIGLLINVVWGTLLLLAILVAARR